MNPQKLHSTLLACSLALAATSVAFAGADKHFKTMDTDGDGKISRTEYAAASRQMFTKCDANRDGVVTVAEMDAIRDEKPGKPEKSSAEKIQMADLNNDGQLNDTEHAAGSEKMFTKMDHDGDGYLSKEECDEGHSKMKKDK